MKATSAIRAPRGTKTLKQAFFSAADSVPEAQRGAVVKAALAAIRDELRAGKERARIAKGKLKAKTAKPTAAKLVAKPVKKTSLKKPAATAAKAKRAKAKIDFESDQNSDLV